MKTTLILILSMVCFCAQAQHTVESKNAYYSRIYDTILRGELITHYVQSGEHATEKEQIDRKTVAAFHADSSLPSRFQVPDFDEEYTEWNKAHPDDEMDRGHVVPYKAMAFSAQSAFLSMCRTNTWAQSKYFNEHQWEKCEVNVIDSFCLKYQTDVDVWTGVLVSISHPKKIGAYIYVPDYYWKVVLCNGKYYAWLGANNAQNKDTKPADMVCTPEHLKQVILQYYPDLKIPF